MRKWKTDFNLVIVVGKRDRRGSFFTGFKRKKKKLCNLKLVNTRKKNFVSGGRGFFVGVTPTVHSRGRQFLVPFFSLYSVLFILNREGGCSGWSGITPGVSVPLINFPLCYGPQNTISPVPGFRSAGDHEYCDWSLKYQDW